MRYVCLPAVTIVAVCGLVPSVVFGQGAPPSFSITNYQYVSEQRISQATSYVTYRADLVNVGAARIAVTASVSSRVSSIQVTPGQGTLHFAPVPANRTVTSLDTFTILVDRTVVFDFADLQWTFLSPVANAGPNRTAKVGSTVILDGSGSTNPSGYGTLTYNWKLVSTPPGSSTVLYWYDTVQPQFTVDVPGNYVLTLTVSNGGGSDSATVTVSTTNTPPVANAGANWTAAPGAVVTLNGSGSSDVDGDPLTYSWTIINRPAGSTAVLLAPASITPVFTVDQPGSYDIRLIVNDGKVDSAPSIVTITTQNTPPVANAGPNQVQTVGALVQLDGSGSTDVDGDPLTYQWSLIGVPIGSTATLSSATAVKPTFTADCPGTYVVQLIVNDGKAASAAATVQITTNPPLAPTASAGPNQTVAHRTTVYLNGSGIDPQNLPLTYQWSLTSKPTLSTAVLSSTTIPNPTFVADMPGNYVAQLIVSNGVLPSAPSMVTITTTNTAPVANPGLNQFVPAPASVLLDGSGSSDADGDPLTYAWSFSSRPDGSTAALSSLTAVSPTFFADVAGTYVVQLIVFDGFAYSSPATVTVTAGVKTITLTPNPLNLSTNSPGSLTVTLGSLAGPGGQIVALGSSNGTIAAIQANVTVAQGMAGVNVQVAPGSGAGSTTITAIANGFTPGFALVNVTPPVVTVTLSAGTIGLTRTINGALTLSSPAPTGGVSVTLSDPAGFVTFQPATVPFAPGATTGTFTATGATIGSTTILAGAPGYNTGTANVTVAMLGAITLLSNITVGPSQSVPFPVSLVTGAPSGGVTIALASSDTSKVTISPSSVTIPQGATTPTQQPTVSGVNLGSADISASAPGFFGDTKTVQVAATLSFQQQTLTIGVNGTQDLTLNLSGPAPANGLVVNISSSNPAAVTVPTTVSFAPTKTSVTVPVTGITVGTSVIHASAPALADTTATVNVVNVGAIGLPSNTTIGLGQSTAFPVTLPSPAPAGGVTVSLASSDSSRVTISPAPITIAAGQTGPPTQPTITGVNVGTANITASATGYTAATQAVQVTATISFAQPSVTITGAATLNVALNLSAPAPSGGLTINLSSSNTNVATVPPTVTFPPNATSVNVPVTGGTPGSAVIHASGTNISGATTNVTVLPAGSVNVPASLSPVLGQSVALAVSLSSAPSSPVTVTLVSSDPAKVSISASTVTIPAGQTTPFIQPQVTGANIGTATVSASAPGYTLGSTAVQVSATIAFTQPNLTITGATTQNLTLNLSAAASGGGLTINLSSSNTGVATVPPTVAFAQGATTATVPVTGVAAGSAVIHASNVPNIADVTANVTVQILGPINLPSNPSVGLSQTVPFPVTLSAPAPAAVTIALASSDPSKVTISASSVSIAQGATAPTQQPTITGINIGSASINATASGYSSGSAAVQVTATIAFTPQSVTLSGGGTQNLTLTLSGQAPSSGLAVNLSSSNVSVATVPSTVTFAQGSTTVLVPLTIVASGSTVIHASNLPNLADTTSNVTVQNSISLPGTITVAPGQQAPFTITLGAPAPASGVTVLLSSSDTSKVTVVSGSVFIDAGQTSPKATPAVNGIDFGTATLTAAASGYGTATASVQVTGSATFFPSTVTVMAGAGAQNLSLTLSAPAPSNITFTLTSSNMGAATAPASVTIPANQNNVNVPVTPVGPGSTTITASTSTPHIANATASVTVTPPGTITLPSNPSVGLGKSVAFPVNLGAPAASSVTITLSSSNLSKLTISPASVTIAAGQTAPAVQPQVTGLDIGTVTISASANGYTAASVPAQVTATISYSPASLTIMGTTTQQFLISLSGAAPAGGIVLTLSSSNTAVATVPPQQTFFPDGSSISTLVIPVTVIGAGTAVIHAGAPPYIPDTTANVTVLSTGTIGLPSNVTLAPNQSATFPVTLGTAAPTGGVTVTLGSSDTSKLTILPASVTIAAGQVAPLTQPTITAVNYGTANINATAPGYSAASAPVQVTATMSFASPAVTINGIATQNVALNLSAPAPSGGLTVNLSSSNTNAATVPASVNFPANAATVNVLVTAVGQGATTITATAVAPGIANATMSVTVLSPATINLPPSNTTVGLGKSATFAISLAAPAPTAVTIALASTDTGKVTISTPTVNIAAGQTTPSSQPTITGVNLGSANITATATGYTSASAAVLVTATVSFTPPSLTISGFTTQNLTLTLSAAAPAGGVTINLSSSTPAAATVPPTVTFNQGATTVNVPVTGVQLGATVIHASALPNIVDTTANVTVQSAGAIVVPASTSVGLGQSVTFAISLPAPAPAPVTVTVSSSDPSKVVLSSGPFTIAQGATAPTTQPQVTGVNIGAVTITASASGYTSSTGTAQTTAAVTFSQLAVTITGIVTQNVTLNLSAPAPSSGLTVNLSSATPGVAQVPSTVTFPASATSVNVPVTTVSLGTAVIHASATPFIADATTTVTVQGGGSVLVPASSTLTLGASTPLAISLSAPAPTALTVTLASSDTSKVTVSPATVSIAQGATTPATQPTITGVKIGTANVTVAAPGYATGTASVQVNATVSFTPQTVTITGLKTQNLTLTLSAAAPAAGLTVNISSSNTVVATTPSTVTFAAGATTVNVPVTALTLGSTVIHASATSFIPDATANVSVLAGGPIGLPSGVTAGLGQSATFAVTLPVAAPAGGVTVTLTSSDPTKVTVTPGTVSIVAGQTTPASQPVVNGINVGSASVSASAPGYTTSSQTVTVAAAVSWPQPTFTLTALGTQNVALILSGAAPASGLTVNLSSTNQLVATVPATAIFTAGSNTVNVPVTAVGVGSTVLHASGLNIPDSTATATVAIATQGVFTVSSVAVGQNLQAQLLVTLSNPVSNGPLQVTLTSSDGSKLVLGSLVGAGTASTILAFPVASNSGIVYAQALAGSGTVTVTASAPGYTSGSGTVTLTPSGFVVTGPTGVVGVPSFPTNVGNTTTLTVMAGRLDSSFTYVETQGLRGAFSVSVPLSSSSTTVGKVSPASVTFTAADTAYTTTFTALSVGATLLSATPPLGFSTPASGANGITANISGGAVSAPNVIVGQSLEVAAQVTLTGAPSVATVVTLTSSDPNRLRFGTSATDPGAGTVPIPGCVPPVPDPTNACKIIKVGAGQSHTPDIYFQALDSTGSATYTAVISGFGTSTGTVSFRPSGILIAGPSGLGNSIATTSGSAAVPLTVESAMLDTSQNFVELQPVAAITGVLPVSVGVTSSNTGVGTITASPVTIPAGLAGATTAFQPGSAGSSTLSVSKPTGFSKPAAFDSVVASVSTSGIAITQGVSIGKFLQIQGNFSLGAPATAGLIVTLASSNSSVLLLSASPTVAGAASIGIPMAAGGSSGTYYLQALAESGTVTYTASAPGFAPHTGTITLTPSGVAVGDGSGGILFGNTATVSMAQLDPGNVFGQIQQLAGGHSPVSIAMSTDVSGATITTPVTISAGADTASAVITGSGSGHVSATTPPGFTDSNVLSVPIFIF